jgi:hypothetical protein
LHDDIVLTAILHFDTRILDQEKVASDEPECNFLLRGTGLF